MPSDLQTPAEPFRRLHPTSLLFSFGAAVRRFLVPGLVLIFFGSGERYELWAMIFAVPMLMYAVFKYVSLRYRLGEEELIVKEGILNRKERNIPYQRIQNIDTKRNLVHRALGVTDVVVQTASGTAPEAVLKVLSNVDAETMRRHVFDRRAAAAPPIAEPAEEGSVMQGAAAAPAAEVAHTVARASIRDLIVFGIISNRGMLAVAAVMGLMVQFGKMPDWQRVAEWSEAVLGIQDWTLLHTGVVIGGGVLAFLVLLRLLSIIWAIVTLYDFRLLRDGDELRTRFGLLTEHALTIPRHRIQLLDIEATILHRAFKRVALRARTAGALQKDEAGTSRDWLMPLLRQTSIPNLLQEAQPELNWAGVPWRPVERRGKRRLLVRWMLWWLIPGVAATAAWWPWGWLAWAFIVPVGVLHAHLKIKSMAYALTPHAVWYKSGWMHWTCRAVRYSKIQAVMLAETPFDRRHRMATIKIDTANAGLGADAIAIPFLDADDAADVRDRLKAEVVGTEFLW